MPGPARAPTAATAPSGTGRGRAEAVFLGLSGLVIAGSFGLRIALLGRQSYWVDELFSVSQASGSLGATVQRGATEIHTPLYATLLWAWIQIGGTGEAWTRLFSTLCAALAVMVTYRGLRGIGLSEHVRRALTVTTAAGGTGLVYSLETRSYALLTLGAVGLTATTLRAALTAPGTEPVPHRQVPHRTLLAWTAWSALVATAHPFGTVLVLGAFGVLGTATLTRAAPGRVRRTLTWAALAAVGCAPQAGWLARGLTRPGFATGTDWIRAPGGPDVGDLITTTFGSGGLTARADGFAWTAPAGTLVVAALLVAAALAGAFGRRRARPPGPGRTADPGTSEGPAAAVLLALVAVVTVATFAVSPWVHVWTLRNMVVITPGLLWGTVCLAAAVSGGAAGRRWVATATVASLGVGLVPLASDLADPYKTDFRGLFTYLAEVRRDHPEAAFFFVGPPPPLGWAPVSVPAAGATGTNPRDLLPRQVPAPDAVARTAGTEVVVLYRGSADRHPDRAVARLVQRLGPTGCHRVPVHGLGVVRCDPVPAPPGPARAAGSSAGRGTRGSAEPDTADRRTPRRTVVSDRNTVSIRPERRQDRTGTPSAYRARNRHGPPYRPPGPGYAAATGGGRAASRTEGPQVVVLPPPRPVLPARRSHPRKP
jgi:hypothetical protein